MKKAILLLTSFVIFVSCSNLKKNEISNIPIRTVVTGKVINSITEEPLVRLALNRVGFEQEEFETELDSTGSFKIEFFTYVPLDAWLVYQTNFQILLNPGDSLNVEFDGSQEDRPELLETVKFAGTSSEKNRQATIFQKLYYSNSLYENDELIESANKKYEPEQFKIFADSLRETSSKFLNDYRKNYNPDKTVLSWATIFLQDDYYGNLTFYPSSYRKANVLKQNEWSVPISYYEYFNEKFPIEEGLQNGHAVSSYLDKYLSYIRAITLNKIKNDELNNHQNKSIAESENERDSTMLKLIMEKTSSELLREAMLTYVFNSFIEYSMIESFDKYQSIAEQNIHSAFLKEPLFKKHKTTKEKIANAKEIETNRIKTLDSFLNGIVTNNKGKVTYIDIWATWCGPCREEFPYSRKLQDKFSDKIEFVFVCIESEERAYKNTLKEFDLKGTHYFLNKEQSKELREKLQLNGVPHYILIDKNGKTIADGFETRPSEDKTEKEIINLIGT